MSVRRRLVERIRVEGPITYADYVESALYDPEGGFYARGARLGLRGAFSTAPTRQDSFAEAVAVEVRTCHSALAGQPELTLVEAGPGDGALAVALSDRLRDVLGEVVLVERAEGMRAAQREALAGAPVPVRWVAEPAEVRAEAGFVVANELFDALAFHLLEWPDEVVVGADEEGRLHEELRPARSGAGDALRVETEPRPGGRYAVRPDAGEMLGALADTIARGRILVADYGGSGDEVHTGRDPVRTYVGGMRGGDPLDAPGSQDLTADVDFGQLRRAGRRVGLRELLYAPQETWRRRLATDTGAVFDPPPGALAAFKVLLLEK